VFINKIRYVCNLTSVKMNLFLFENCYLFAPVKIRFLVVIVVASVV